tara:strand:+ start:733 stop:1350 length:618 start_codon:yes stop_codon:yes gene_type:complete
MTNHNILGKLFFLAKVILIYLLFCVSINSSEQNVKGKLITVGINDAPVIIKVFSSLTCPHCANFHMNVVPKLKKYIDSGKVQIIFIDFPLDKAAFNASKLLHCLDKKKQISFLDKIYKDQEKWISGSTIDEINNNLKKMVKSFGINNIEFDKCVNSDIIADRILNSRINAHKKYSIEATPTIVINEKKLKEASLKNIIKRIEKLI